MINSISQKHSFLHRALIYICLYQSSFLYSGNLSKKEVLIHVSHMKEVRVVVSPPSGYAIGDFKRIGIAAGLFISGAKVEREGTSDGLRGRGGKLLRGPAGEESREQSQILECLKNQNNASFVFCSPTLTVRSFVCMR